MPLNLMARISLVYERLKLVRFQHGLSQLSQHDKIDEINASARAQAKYDDKLDVYAQLLKGPVRSWESFGCQPNSASSSLSDQGNRLTVYWSLLAKSCGLKLRVCITFNFTRLDYAASIFRYDGPANNPPGF